jgi:hypothetical protein
MLVQGRAALTISLALLGGAPGAFGEESLRLVEFAVTGGIGRYVGRRG